PQAEPHHTATSPVGHRGGGTGSAVADGRGRGVVGLGLGDHRAVADGDGGDQAAGGAERGRDRHRAQVAGLEGVRRGGAGHPPRPSPTTPRPRPSATAAAGPAQRWPTGEVAVWWGSAWGTIEPWRMVTAAIRPPAAQSAAAIVIARR